MFGERRPSYFCTRRPKCLRCRFRRSALSSGMLEMYTVHLQSHGTLVSRYLPCISGFQLAIVRTNYAHAQPIILRFAQTSSSLRECHRENIMDRAPLSHRIFIRQVLSDLVPFRAKFFHDSAIPFVTIPQFYVSRKFLLRYPFPGFISLPDEKSKHGKCLHVIVVTIIIVPSPVSTTFVMMIGRPLLRSFLNLLLFFSLNESEYSVHRR